MNENIEHLKQAVQFALDGDWDAAHKIAQDYADESANWIHAVLHKIEGDEWNSMYWYKKPMASIMKIMPMRRLSFRRLPHYSFS